MSCKINMGVFLLFELMCGFNFTVACDFPYVLSSTEIELAPSNIMCVPDDLANEKQ